MRIKFDEQLEILNNELTEMGLLVEKAIASAVEALRQNDKNLAKQAISFDLEIDQKEKDIEAICLRLFLHQQPVATDLRKVSSALKMITDMERIGDMASDISEITMMDTNLLAVSNLEHISQMEKETIQMVNESIKAFVKKDIQLAQKVIDDDDIVDALFEKVKSVNIFARVYPNHKMRIVNALQRDNKVVAMTGDGVNDAPALKKANIGIAMGKRGTNVAKESADLILLDDNFNTIVKTIENGRNIYKNIRKAISYIIAIHIPIALLSLFVPIFKLPTLLLPIHVMLLELLIDPTSSIIFQRIKPTEDVMMEKPRNIKESILNSKTAVRNILQGLLIFLVVFVTYFCLIHNNIDVNLSITIAYTISVLSIMLITYQLKGNSLTLKSFVESFKDKVSLIVNLCTIFVLILFIYIPFLNKVSYMVPLELKWWICIVILVLFAVIPFDIFKIIDRIRKSKNKR